MEIPEIGQRYKHTSGAEYTVVLIANISATRELYPITVVYTGEDGCIWARPLNQWYRSMTLMVEL